MHYRQFLVALVFADLPSLSRNDFYTCISIMLHVSKTNGLCETATGRDLVVIV